MDVASARVLLDRLSDGDVLWLMHVSADPDCVASTFALQEAFGGAVGAPDAPNKAGVRLAQSLGLAIDTWPHPEKFRTVVAVDLGSRSSLGRLGDKVPRPFLVDHHRYGDLHEDAPAMAWDPARASCAEVVLALLDAAGKKPSPAAARALLTGIVTDTARFRHADASSLRSAARLVEASGASLEQVLDELSGEDDEKENLDQRRAMLLAATRARIDTVGEHLVAFSEVGAHDAAAAAALVRAGADLAVVGRERAREARLSLRASLRLRDRGIHLGELANEAARDIDWSGGGHEGAAGLRGDPPLARAQKSVLRHVRERLEAD